MMEELMDETQWRKADPARPDNISTYFPKERYCTPYLSLVPLKM